VTVQGDGGSSVSGGVLGGIGNSEEANDDDRGEPVSISRERGFGAQNTSTGSTDETSQGTDILSAADEQHLEVTVQGDYLTAEFSNSGDEFALTIGGDFPRYSEEGNDEDREDSMSISSFYGFGTQATPGTGNTDDISSEAPQSTADGQHLEVAVRCDHLTDASHQGGLANEFSNGSALVEETNREDWEESVSDTSFHGFSGQGSSTRNLDEANQGAAFSDGATSDEDLQEDEDETERGDEDENIFGNILAAQTAIRQVPEVEVGNSPMVAFLR